MNKKIEIFTQAKNMGKALCDVDKYVLLNDYKELDNQLQSYKDKIDKLRELIKATPLPSSDYTENFTTMFMFKKDILDILNEGE